MFDCWRLLHDVLTRAPWSQHPTTGELPLVIFGGAVELPDECVIVVGQAAADTDAQWATFGQPAQDETFTLRVFVQTIVPGLDSVAAFARLQQLVSIVERSLRDETNGKPIGGFEQTITGVLWHSVARVSPQLIVTPEGAGANADVDVSFRSRI